VGIELMGKELGIDAEGSPELSEGKMIGVLFEH
jgi:hypothetical protein